MHSTFAKSAQGFHRRKLRLAADAARPAMRAATSGFLPVVQAKLRVGTPSDRYEQERPLAIAQNVPAPAREPSAPVSTPPAWPVLPTEPAPAPCQPANVAHPLLRATPPRNEASSRNATMPVLLSWQQAGRQCSAKA